MHGQAKNFDRIEGKMAPIEDFDIVPKRVSKGKVVRFADHEGHDLCEVFHITCSYECNGIETEKPIKRSKGRRPKQKPLTLVTMPSTQDQLKNRMELQNVMLENIVKTQKGIIGMAAVKNMAFHKVLSVRYSFDGWKTTLESQGAFYRQDHSNQTDYFVFVLTSKSACFDAHWGLDFAICYKVAGKEFWDNNDGRNYQVYSE